MKTQSENYKVVSVMVAIALGCALVFLIFGGLQHAINISDVSPVSPDQAYVDGINHAGADQ